MHELNQIMHVRTERGCTDLSAVAAAVRASAQRARVVRPLPLGAARRLLRWGCVRGNAAMRVERRHGVCARA